MNFEKTSNPAFSTERFKEAISNFAGTGQMTVKGTATKSLLLLALAFLTATITWKLVGVGSSAAVPLMITGIIGALVAAIFCCVKQEKAYIWAPIYALFEGLSLGAISATFSEMVQGIVPVALFLTLAITGVVFACYHFGVLKASNTFIKVITYATMGIGAFYLISLILSLFGVHINTMSMGPIGLIIQIVIVAIAALNLVLDFKTIEDGVNQGAPAHFEWYASFGLMVTLVWIYMEILRLLLIIANASRD